MAAMTKAAHAELTELEATIRAGLDTFRAVGRALLTIKDKQLYRANYTSFEEYTRERWGFSGERARLLIDAAAIMDQIGSQPMVGRQPANLSERHVRELKDLAPPEAARVLDQAAGDQPSGKTTAQRVRELAAKMILARPAEEQKAVVEQEEREVLAAARVRALRRVRDARREKIDRAAHKLAQAQKLYRALGADADRLVDAIDALVQRGRVAGGFGPEGVAQLRAARKAFAALGTEAAGLVEDLDALLRTEADELREAA